MNGKQASIHSENDSLMVTGSLNFFTVMNLWNQSLPLLSQSTTLNFDFSNVIETNSAGLALIIEWIKYAKHHQKTVKFNYLPPQLMSIAAVAGINSLLGN